MELKRQSKFGTLIFLLTISLFSTGIYFEISQENGFIKGDSGISNGDVFPIIAEHFELIISEFRNDGHDIQLTIPVSEISTDNWMRDFIMRISVLDASKGDITFYAHYVGNLEDGYPDGIYELNGDMTINGIANSNKVNLNFYRKNGKDFVKGSAIVSLENYHILAPGLGGIKVIDKISIIIDLKL